MDLQTVYLETSIISYLASRPSRDLLIVACQQATRDWWLKFKFKYRLFISTLVVKEASAGDPDAAKRRIEYFQGIPELRITVEVEELAKILISEGALPRKAEADALHIAISSVHRVELLLTWNCRHIDNPTMKPIIRSICAVAGYSCPEICTPFEMLEMRYYEE